MPLSVEHDTAKLQDHLGAVASPAHAGSIKSQSNEVAYGPFDGAASDVEFRAAQCGVWHALVVLGEIVEDAQQALTAALVAWSGLRDSRPLSTYLSDPKVVEVMLNPDGTMPCRESGRSTASPRLWTQLGRRAAWVWMLIQSYCSPACISVSVSGMVTPPRVMFVVST